MSGLQEGIRGAPTQAGKGAREPRWARLSPVWQQAVGEGLFPIWYRVLWQHRREQFSLKLRHLQRGKLRRLSVEKVIELR